jgi:two-component system, NarL family, invasion response regulator UvrY
MKVPQPTPIRVLIADDHRLVRRGLWHILTASPGTKVVGEASSYSDIIQVLRQYPCDVLLLDISMQGKDGIEILHLLKKREPTLKIIILSGHGPEQFAVRALKAGAACYLTKDAAPDELVEAIHAVARGSKYITEGVAESLANHVIEEDELMLHEQLTDREFQTVRMIAAGKTRTEIAQNLSISPKTVSVYRSRAFEKIGVRTNAQLAYYAIKHGLIE